MPARPNQPDLDYLASPQAMLDLRALNAQFIENFIRNDVTAHDALLHPDFLYIRGNGARIGRKAYLEGWATGFDPEMIIYWDTRDELITLIGPVALVRATNRYVERVGGVEVSGMAAYTDIYLREEGVWRCIQAQITPVAAGCEPPDETIISVYLKGVRQL
jgi:hypothetical protein